MASKKGTIVEPIKWWGSPRWATVGDLATELGLAEDVVTEWLLRKWSVDVLLAFIINERYVGRQAYDNLHRAAKALGPSTDTLVQGFIEFMECGKKKVSRVDYESTAGYIAAVQSKGSHPHWGMVPEFIKGELL
jgi:hypothetical protein